MRLRRLVQGWALGLGVALMSAAGAEPASTIPFRQDQEGSADLAGRALVALLVCGVAGAAGIHFLRRRGLPAGMAPLRGSRRVRVLEVQSIGLKNAVVLLRWDDEEILISHGEGCPAQVLARRPVKPEAQ